MIVRPSTVAVDLPMVDIMRDVLVGAGKIETFGRGETSDRRDVTELRAGQHLEIAGWALAQQPWALFDQLLIAVDGAVVQQFTYDRPREDVAAIRRDQTLLRCGFWTEIPVAGLAPGLHAVALLGRRQDRMYAIGEERVFGVLAEPRLTAPRAQRETSAGRIRIARGRRDALRHDGRTAEAIEPGVSLLIAGWSAGLLGLDASDEIAVALVGFDRAYRARARRAIEPEAGVVLGASGTGCGFHSLIDAAAIVPGMYRIGLDAPAADRRFGFTDGVWVEIMGNTHSWFPGLLPTYREAPRCSFDVPPPSRVRKHMALVLSGTLDAPEAISGIYARLDDESTYTLTHLEAGPETRSTASRRVYRFAGLLAMPFALGPHVLDIIAADRTVSGGWLAYRHRFEVIDNRQAAPEAAPNP